MISILPPYVKAFYSYHTEVIHPLAINAHIIKLVILLLHPPLPKSIPTGDFALVIRVSDNARVLYCHLSLS
jgi:hypothetical protein